MVNVLSTIFRKESLNFREPWFFLTVLSHISLMQPNCEMECRQVPIIQSTEGSIETELLCCIHYIYVTSY